MKGNRGGHSNVRMFIIKKKPVGQKFQFASFATTGNVVYGESLVSAESYLRMKMSDVNR